MFYVYEWYVKDTKEIFYVGKGCGRRYKVTQDRNAQFTKMINQYDCDSRIIKEFQNEKDAFDYEKQRIDELKVKGLCKCNIYSDTLRINKLKQRANLDKKIYFSSSKNQH